jgi:hypothetical protein
MLNTQVPTIDEILLKSTMTDYGIPQKYHGGLVRYIISGLKPGSFLCSVLANDLLFAVCRADDEVTLEHLKALVRFLNSEVPMECHGSHKLVVEYMAAKQKQFEKEHGIEATLKRLQQSGVGA